MTTNIEAKNLFDTALTMVIPIIAGIIGAKRGYFKDAFEKKLSAFVLNIAQPFMIVASIIGTEYSAENLKSGLLVLLSGTIAHFIAAAVALGATFFIKDQRERRISEFCMIFSNCGFFGFPILRAVYGAKGVFWGGFFIVIFNLIMWTYGVFILSRANRELKIKLTKIFINHGTVPCVLGFLLFVLRVKLYQPIFDGVDLLGSTCTPLSMVLVGAMIARIPFRELLSKPSTYYVTAIRLAVMPMLSGVILRLIGFSYDISVFGALMMALPCAAGSAMFAETYDIRPDLAARCVGVSTLLSVVSVPLILPLVERVLTAFF